MTTGINGSSSGLATLAFQAMQKNRFKQADQDGDGKITKDELTNVIPPNGKGPGVDEVFTKVDTNQDGVIDQTEDAAATQQMRPPGGMDGSRGPRGPGGPPPPPPEAVGNLASNLFKSVDADEDGSITKQELTTALSEDDQTASIDAKELFQLLDTDADGNVTQAELESALQQMFAARHSAEVQGCCGGYDKFGEGTGESAMTSTFTAVA